jgi:hypothetical protein
MMSDAERPAPRREQVQQTDRHSARLTVRPSPSTHRRDWLFVWIVIVVVVAAAVLVGAIVLRSRSDAAVDARVSGDLMPGQSTAAAALWTRCPFVDWADGYRSEAFSVCGKVPV